MTCRMKYLFIPKYNKMSNSNPIAPRKSMGQKNGKRGNVSKCGRRAELVKAVLLEPEPTASETLKKVLEILGETPVQS